MIDLFKECINDVGYISTPHRGNYKTQKNGRDLVIYFQKSCGFWDWISNFDFSAVPYKDMADEWRCHRGFLRVWKGMRDEIAAKVRNVVDGGMIDTVTCVGYSHGAALCALAVEDLTYRFGASVAVCGYGFGAPRVVYGWLPDVVRERFSRFRAVRCGDDIVTHLPPRFMGYVDYDRIVQIGVELSTNPISAHMASSYLVALGNQFEQGG